MTKVYWIELDDENPDNQWILYGTDGEILAHLYDEEIAERVVDLLNAFVSNGLDEDEYDEPDDDDDYGDAVDEFISKNEHTYTDWDEESK